MPLSCIPVYNNHVDTSVLPMCQFTELKPEAIVSQGVAPPAPLESKADIPVYPWHSLVPLYIYNLLYLSPFTEL